MESNLVQSFLILYKVHAEKLFIIRNIPIFNLLSWPNVQAVPARQQALAVSLNQQPSTRQDHSHISRSSS